MFGRQKNEKSAIHIVSAWLSKQELSIGQVKVDEKSKEITVIPELLDKLDLKQSIISIDAQWCTDAPDREHTEVQERWELKRKSSKIIQ